MQNIRNSVLKHVRLRCRKELYMIGGNARFMTVLPDSTKSEQLMIRMINLVKEFDKTGAKKVTETANFQKDLSLDSLDLVDLIMEVEREFSIEIPDVEADKFTCCADVVKYITEAQSKKEENS